MNKNILIGSVLALLCLGTAQAAEIQLTPNTNAGGRLPSGYTRLTFTLSDGNWAPSIVLPSTPTDGAQVLLSSAAGYGSSVDTTKVDLPLNPLPLVAGDSYQFTWSATAGKWTVSGSKVAYYTPNQNSAVIPDTHPRISFYTTSDSTFAILGPREPQVMRLSGEAVKWSHASGREEDVDSSSPRRREFAEPDAGCRRRRRCSWCGTRGE